MNARSYLIQLLLIESDNKLIANGSNTGSHQILRSRTYGRWQPCGQVLRNAALLIKAGKNVYIEWPLGMALLEKKWGFELIQVHSTKLAVVGFQVRYSPITQKTKTLVGRGFVSTGGGAKHLL